MTTPRLFYGHGAVQALARDHPDRTMGLTLQRMLDDANGYATLRGMLIDRGLLKADDDATDLVALVGVLLP